MTEGKHIFSRFFRVLVMLHKIPYAHFTEWNNKRKRKAFAAGIYFLSIIPNLSCWPAHFWLQGGKTGMCIW